jgi:hypothetical protein
MINPIDKITESQAVSIINEAAESLQQEGKVYVQSILHQMGVDINDGVPNLVFIPNEEDNEGEKRVFVVEFKPTDAEVLPDIFVANANQHKHWLEEANENRFKIEYGLSSNGDVIAGSERGSEIIPIASVTKGEDLADRVRAWVKGME